MLNIFSYEISQTMMLAKAIGERIAPGTVLAMEGDLGAGKTVFAKGLALGLGITERIKSPTFNLLMDYWGRHHFVHIDAYRISEDEVFEAGLLEYFDDESIVLVEWPSNFGYNLPPALRVEIIKHYSEENEWREIIFHCEKGDYFWLDTALKQFQDLKGE